MRAARRRTLGRVRARLSALQDRIRYRIRPRIADAGVYLKPLEGKEGLEIGGASAVFRDPTFIPVYRHVSRVDNVNFSATTVWQGSVPEGPVYAYLPGRPNGFQFIREATDLRGIDASRYDFVLASHVLEHIANPIGALREWIRVLKPGGLMLLVLPHREGTFDHRRPPTDLQHMISDDENGTTEADLSHLPEILASHDLARDPAAADFESFRTRSLQNASNRCLHHHVFDLRTAVCLVDYSGLQILAAQTAQPYHVIVLARKQPARDNRQFLDPEADLFARSCFRTDRPTRHA